MKQPERDPIVNSVHRLENASFAELTAMVRQLGANKGDRQVIDLYRTWIALQGAGGRQSHAAWFNLGAEWSDAGDDDNAILAYRTALALRPDFSPAAINLGLLLERRGEPATALACWTDALQTDEARVGLLNQRARLLEQLDQLTDAEAAMRASLTIRRDQPEIIRHWLRVRQSLCLWPVLSDAVSFLSPTELMASCGKLTALALTDEVSVRARAVGAWIEREIPQASLCLAPETGYRHDRIRLGYISSDFRLHAMSYALAELVERHDRSRFEIHGYCTSPEDGSDVRLRMIAAFDNFSIIRDLPAEAAARAIRADEIDILIDLNGLSSGIGMAILRWRPARIQATWLGFIGPVPMPELDFLLCDQFVIPPIYAALYQPRSLRGSPMAQSGDADHAVSEPITRSSVGLPEDRFIFCCFSDHYKITEAVFGAWMAILLRVEGSVLWLTEGNPRSPDNLRAAATSAGVDPARLLFAGGVEPGEATAHLALADLFLDTFPADAGPIAVEAFRAGLPTVTLGGESFTSGTTGRLALAIGATAGIAESLAEYIEIAVSLATRPDLLAAYRSLFTSIDGASAIGDIATFTYHYEESLIAIELARRPQIAPEPEPIDACPSPDFAEAEAA